MRCGSTEENKSEVERKREDRDRIGIYHRCCGKESILSPPGSCIALGDSES